MILGFLVFLLLLSGFVALGHRYLYMRLVRDPALPPAWRKAGAVLCVVLLLGTFAGVLVPGRYPSQGLHVWTILAYAWIGTLFVFVLTLGVLDAVLWVGHIAGRRKRRSEMTVPDPARRLFLSRSMAVGATLGAGGVSARGVDSALHELVVREVEIPIPRLPASLRGFRIAQLSDVHIGLTLGAPFLEEVVRKTNELRPDLVAITGDLVDGTVKRLGPTIALLQGLRSPYGTYFVTGNHEYYSGADSWCDELTRLGVNVLRNRRMETGPEGALDIVGVDDWLASRRGDGQGHDLKRAVSGRDPSRPALLLAHQPRAIDDAAKHGMDVQLSGHTHGGQIWPFRFLVWLQQPYIHGLHLHEARTWIFVHAGTGFWGPPMRIGVPAEIALIRLV